MSVPSPSHKATTHPSRDFGLDVLRAAAISFVLITHVVVVMRLTSANIVTHGYLPTLGFAGVELFFGLSGFLIGSILLADKLSAKQFYLRRFAKILPPYLIILGVLALSVPASPLIIWSHVFFFQTFFPEAVEFFPVSWSLTFEVWFYVLAPALVLNRYVKPDGRRLLVTCLALVFGILAARTIYAIIVQPHWEFGFHRFVPLRFDALIFGVLAAALAAFHPRLLSVVTSRLYAWANVAIFLALNGIFAGLYYGHFSGRAWFWFETLGLSAYGLSIMGLVLAARRYVTGACLPVWLVRAVTWFSRVSYSLYLVHLFIFFQVAKLSGKWFPKYLLGILLSLIASGLFYRFIEEPVLRARKAFERKYVARARG